MIKIDDTEYQIEDMTDEQKALTSLVQQCQGKVAAIKVRIRYCADCAEFICPGAERIVAEK
jgi:hypothetical protein